MQRVLNIYTVFLVLSSFLVVIISAHLSGYEGLLATATKESGFFEWMSVLILMTVFNYGIYFCKKHYQKLSKTMLILIGGFALVAFLGAMEEISWGQHLFHFESSEYFVKNNHQQETNLHNFMPAELFSSIIYSSIYGLFVFIPLVTHLLSPYSHLLTQLKPWVATPIMSLIVLYGATFQAFFYDNFGAWVDMGTLLAGILLFGVVMFLRFQEHYLRGFYLFLLITLSLFMVSYKVFGFFNMQYEIREMFVGLALLYYYIFLTQKWIRNQN
ncbi:MAG: hypothetical protein U9N52_01910 [Campylobacterota bacterium]|nr:hypothetical protein [Campylobacterota bacterium]